MVTTNGGRLPCSSALRIAAHTAVLCMLLTDHAQHCYPGGIDCPEPTHHQGAWMGQVYVWTTGDAGVISTLRNGGFHAQCDRMAAKLAVVVTQDRRVDVRT